MCGNSSLVVRRLYKAWRRQDVSGVLACCKDDIVYAINPFRPEQSARRSFRGRFEVSAVLYAMCWDWEFLDLAPGAFRAEGDGSIVRERMWFKARHRATGNILESTKRHVWHLRGGRIACCDEFEDAEFIRAFLQMADGV